MKSKNIIKQITNFFSEVKVEMQKVSWTTKEELTGSTVMVIITVLILALVIGIWDFILSKLQTIVYYR